MPRGDSSAKGGPLLTGRPSRCARTEPGRPSRTIARGMRSNNPAAVFPDRAGTFMRPASHKDIDRQAMEHQMSDFVLRMYDTLPHAELARDALLAAGYGTEQVQIEAMNSEAGPVQGNFTVGDRSDRSDHSGIGDSGDYG